MQKTLHVKYTFIYNKKTHTFWYTDNTVVEKDSPFRWKSWTIFSTLKTKFNCWWITTPNKIWEDTKYDHFNDKTQLAISLTWGTLISKVGQMIVALISGFWIGFSNSNYWCFYLQNSWNSTSTCYTNLFMICL